MILHNTTWCPMRLFDVTNIANEYVTNRLTNFGNSEEIKTRFGTPIIKSMIRSGAGL